ncbi:MAG: ATP-dependent nuclease, partial [Minisyncoccia bacterium]
MKEIDDISVEKLEHGFQGVNDVVNIIKKVKISLNDGIISDAKLKGSGTQRGLIFSLLRLIAEKRRNSRNRETIFLIDEPDLHLHPQLQKQIKVIIEKLSENYPVIVATHSHLMIGKRVPTIGIIKKIYKENNVVKSEEISDEERLFRELFTYLGYIPSDFLLPDNIIIVGGQLDKLFLDKIIEILKKEKLVDTSYDVSVINIGGDGQINKVIPLLNDLESAVNFFQGLPVYKNRFCMILDAKKEKSLSQLRNNANDKNDGKGPYRIIALNNKKDKNGNSLDGIEFYYPESLIKKYCGDNKLNLDDIVKSNDKKRRLSDFILENLNENHLNE